MINLNVLSKRFVQDEKGAVFILFGLLIFVLLAIGGAGIDYARSEIIRHKMHQASDAAALAGLTLPAGTSEADRRAVIDRYFRLNFPDNYMGSDITPASLVVTYTPDGTNPTSINIKLSDTINGYFTNLVGMSELGVNSETEVQIGATASPRDIDVVLVLDSSGSMADPTPTGGSKMQSLKSAANNLITTFLGAANMGPGDQVRLGLVEFNNIITPNALTDNEAGAHDYINALYSDGMTFGGDAAVAGKNALLGAPPRASDGLTGAVKVMVFLTDGINTRWDGYVEQPDPAQDVRFTTACNNMKASGVVIYTFRYGNGGDASLLRDCASNPKTDFYYDAGTGTELVNRFNTISEEINRIRIVH